MIPLIIAIPFGVGYLLNVGATNAEDYRSRQRWASLLLVLLMGAIAAAIILALFAPMTSLIQSISGGASKK